jgi:hypothetical protein
MDADASLDGRIGVVSEHPHAYEARLLFEILHSTPKKNTQAKRGT